MSDPTPPGHERGAQWRAGLRMAKAPDPERLAAEKRELAALDEAPFLTRWGAFVRRTGPGYLQSAMTLGGGSAAASLFAGAAFGYALLWVAPLAMLIGIVMLSAVAWQTLSTGMRPFEAMRRFAGAPFAWTWAIGALAASIIWHFPQYSLASAVLVDVGDVAGMPDIHPMVPSVLVLVVAIALSFSYGVSTRAIRWYENALKLLVWGIVLCFGLVVWKTGIDDWGALLRGLFTFQVPAERNGVGGATTVLSGLSAAVGINMLFLYPYSLLAKGWGREHRRLARFDLFSGMFLPYTLATTLMVVAMANTVFLDPDFTGTRLSPAEAAQALAGILGDTWGRVVFNLGVLAMAMSTITMHMLCAGFVGVELCDLKVGSWGHRLFTLLPAPGVLGPILWSDVAVWIAVPTSIVCGFFLPVAYLAFVRMQSSDAYLGEDRPRGGAAKAWIGAMVAITIFLAAFYAWYAISKGPGYYESSFG